MFTKAKERKDGFIVNSGHAYRTVEERVDAVFRGTYQAPWLGRHILEVLTLSFAGLLIALAVAFASGAFN